MKRIFALTALLALGSAFAADDVPLKLKVSELLAHPDRYDGQRVDVRGYYTAGMEDSSLWASARARDSSHGNLDDSIYIDPIIWDPRYHPSRPKDLLDAENLKDRFVRVVGTFRSHPLPPWVVTIGGGHGPTITDVSYFRPAR
jgi:hypothetical protein